MTTGIQPVLVFINTCPFLKGSYDAVTVKHFPHKKKADEQIAIVTADSIRDLPGRQRSGPFVKACDIFEGKLQEKQNRLNMVIGYTTITI